MGLRVFPGVRSRRSAVYALLSNCKGSQKLRFTNTAMEVAGLERGDKVRLSWDEKEEIIGVEKLEYEKDVSEARSVSTNFEISLSGFYQFFNIPGDKYKGRFLLTKDPGEAFTKIHLRRPYKRPVKTALAVCRPIDGADNKLVLRESGDAYE